MTAETASSITAWSAIVSTFATIVMAWFAWTSVRVSRDAVAIAKRSQEFVEEISRKSAEDAKARDQEAEVREQRFADLLQALVVIIGVGPKEATSIAIEVFRQYYKGKTKLF